MTRPRTSPVPDAGEEEAAARRRDVLGVVLMAFRRNPHGSWPQINWLARQFGAGLDPPITQREVGELRKMTVSDALRPRRDQ